MWHNDILQDILHHDCVADEYDGLYVYPRKYRFLAHEVLEDLQNIFGLQQGAHILDLGSGTGAIAIPLSKHFKVYALEPSRRMLVRTMAKGIENCVQAIASAIPFKPRSFDGVVSSKTLHHIPDSLLRPTLMEVHNVLKENGVFYIIEDHVFEGPMAEIESRVAKRIMPQRYPSGIPTHSPHEHGITFNRLKNALNATGFTIKHKELSFYYPYRMIEFIKDENLAYNLWKLPKKLPILKRLGGVVKVGCIKR